jgi:2,5-furandicarboxylate decarboxylase 1
MAIAVDPDIDIYDPRDVHYAISTRVDPSRDVIIIGNARGFMFDPSAHPVFEASPDTAQTRLPSVVGKWGIDATKPVPYRVADRKNYERAWPMAWGSVKLDDYLSKQENK